MNKMGSAHTGCITSTSWSEDEDAIIRAHPDLWASRLVALLPGRSAKAIHCRRRRLHVPTVVRAPAAVPAPTPIGVAFATQSGLLAIRNAENGISLPFLSFLHDSPAPPAAASSRAASSSLAGGADGGGPAASNEPGRRSSLAHVRPPP